MTPAPTLAAGPRPVASVAQQTPYVPPPRDPAILDLAGNEGPPVRAPEWAQLPLDALRRYPRPAELEARLAARWDLPAAGCWVGAGADEALDRLCRSYLAPGRELLVATPTFAMLPRYAQLCGAEVVEVPWPEGPLPRAELLARVSERTGILAVVSPNNPTGAVASAEDVRALAAAAPGAVILLDAAYAEFADEDWSGEVLDLPNVVVARTFSKAYGLAGLRVGYLLGAPELLAPLRVFSPFPVAGPSLWLAQQAAERGPDAAKLARVRAERARLSELAALAGLRAQPSQGNFVLLRGLEPGAFSAALLERGIAVRTFANAELTDAARITCPGEARAFAQVERALIELWGLALAPSPLSVVEPAPPSGRRARVQRSTRETQIELELNLDGSGAAEVSTGIGFLDHMLTSFARHGGLDLRVTCAGDLEVDDHHTAEDVALCLGAALDEALGERRGIERFGEARVPMDEARAEAALDLSGRPYAVLELGLRREQLGRIATENLTHFFRSFATAGRLCLHLEVPRGENDHHRAEAAFKACARALRLAVRPTGGDAVPSTKGIL